MVKKEPESIFSVYIEDVIGALIFCVLFLYLYVNGYCLLDVLIYSAMISGIATAVIYLIRKLTEKN